MNHYLFITGHNRVGKGTVADNIQKKLETSGYRVYRIALADRLKKLTMNAAYTFYLMAVENPGAAYIDFKGWMNANKEDVYRYLLRGFGQMARQYICQSFWLDRLLEDTPLHKNVARIILVDDCRYPNEAEYVLNNGGLLIGVAGYNREKYESAYSSRRLLDMQYGSHPSVQGVTFCMEAAHCVVGNNGNLSQLREALRLQVFQHPEWHKFLERVDADRQQSDPQTTQESSESGEIRETGTAASTGSRVESEPPS